MRYLLKQGEKILAQKFNSKTAVNQFIEDHLIKGGLDWRAGYFFKARTDKEPIQVIVEKTGLPLKR